MKAYATVIVLYLALIVFSVVGYFGNLFHAFTAAGSDLLWSVVGVFIPFIGVLKFWFF